METIDKTNFAKEYCIKNPEWKMICDIPDLESMYYTWDELKKSEKNKWIKAYGDDAREAWEEFGDAECKVEYAFVAEDGKLYKKIIDMKSLDFMQIYKIK